MRIKPLQIAYTAAFVAAAQLLFFWLVPTRSELFAATYPFYTALTTGHVIACLLLGSVYRYPASFAPSAAGGAVVIAEMAAGILFGSLYAPVRTAMFVQAIILSVYILVMALFVSICAKESVRSTPPVSARPSVSGLSRYEAEAIASTSRRPRAVSSNER